MEAPQNRSRGDQVMDQPLHIELKEKTLFVTLNSPKRRNALSLEMLNALDQTLDKANKNQEVAVIVLGATGHVFCPGHDLKEMTLPPPLDANWWPAAIWPWPAKRPHSPHRA